MASPTGDHQLVCGMWRAPISPVPRWQGENPVTSSGRHPVSSSGTRDPHASASQPSLLRGQVAGGRGNCSTKHTSHVHTPVPRVHLAHAHTCPHAPENLTRGAQVVSYPRAQLRGCVAAHESRPGPVTLGGKGIFSFTQRPRLCSPWLWPQHRRVPHPRPLWTVRPQDPKASPSPPHWTSPSHVGSPYPSPALVA